MKRISSIAIVGGGNELCKEIYNYVKHDIPKEWAIKYKYSGHGLLTLPLEENSSSYQYVMEMARKHELNPTVFQKVHYTNAEIDRSAYFELRIPSPLELEGTEAADYGTQYVGGCTNPRCRLGKTPVGNVLVDRKFMKKYGIGTLLPDIFVSEQIRDLIYSNNLTGISFDHDVKDFKGRDMPKFYIMEINSVLPPMASSTWLVHGEYVHQRYSECGHQVVYLRSDLQYEKEKLYKAKDFNLSSEYVNNDRLQVIIVSQKVRNIFRQHKIRAGFFPVAIIG